MLYCSRSSLYAVAFAGSPAGTNIQATSAEAAGRVEWGLLGHRSTQNKKARKYPSTASIVRTSSTPVQSQIRDFPMHLLVRRGGELTSPALLDGQRRGAPRSTQHPAKASRDEEPDKGATEKKKEKQSKAQPADRILFKKPDLLLLFLLVVFRVASIRQTPSFFAHVLQCEKGKNNETPWNSFKTRVLYNPILFRARMSALPRRHLAVIVIGPPRPQGGKGPLTGGGGGCGGGPEAGEGVCCTGARAGAGEGCHLSTPRISPSIPPDRAPLPSFSLSCSPCVFSPYPRFSSAPSIQAPPAVAALYTTLTYWFLTFTEFATWEIKKILWK